MGPNDALLFYFAGHGSRLWDAQEAFLACRNSRVDRPESMLSVSDLIRALRRLAAHHTLVLLDSCYGGVALERGGAAEKVVELAPVEPRCSAAATRGIVSVGSTPPSLPSHHCRTGRSAGRRPVRDSRRSTPSWPIASPNSGGTRRSPASCFRGAPGADRPAGWPVAGLGFLGYFMNATLVSDERLRVSQIPRYGASAREAATS